MKKTEKPKKNVVSEKQGTKK